MFQASTGGVGGGYPAGLTPLMNAALSRSNEVVDVLLLAGANTNTVDSNGHTALTYALTSKDMAIIDKLSVLTTEGREEAFRMIASNRINISEPLLQFIRESLSTTGKILFGSKFAFALK